VGIVSSGAGRHRGGRDSQTVRQFLLEERTVLLLRFQGRDPFGELRAGSGIPRLEVWNLGLSLSLPMSAPPQFLYQDAWLQTAFVICRIAFEIRESSCMSGVPVVCIRRTAA